MQTANRLPWIIIALFTAAILAGITILILRASSAHAAGHPFGERLPQATIYTVNITTDENDGSCSDVDCSLRDAIIKANAATGDKEIRFNIPGCGGVCTISLSPALGALPALTAGHITIDGYTQPGALAATNVTPATLLIELRVFNDFTHIYPGINIQSSHNTIKGLVINGAYFHYGISITGSGANSNDISGNYISTNASGNASINNLTGILISNYAHDNLIGGDQPGDRNLISGNLVAAVQMVYTVTENTVAGNYIGTAADGAGGVPNGNDGVNISFGAFHNTIGGDSPGEGNLLSGNSRDGVRITGNHTISNTISGNIIGLDASGNVALPNEGSGVYIASGAYLNTIGGDTAGERNIISGNQEHGVYIHQSGTEHNTVSGNYIGTDANGTIDLGNHRIGVNLEYGPQANTIGGDMASERNLISGNEYGVILYGAGTDKNVISGNYIGTNSSGTASLGNDKHGVYIGYGAQGNTLGGDTPGERNVISGNASGVYLYDVGTNANKVLGNYIGTDASGTVRVHNWESGVVILDGASSNHIGGENPGEGNLISGNLQRGLLIWGTNTSGNHVVGNLIGTDAYGYGALGNGFDGVEIKNGAHDNTIGPGNVIAYNYNGVSVSGNSSLGNIISMNSIFSPHEMGIDLIDGANGNINAPVILGVTHGSWQVSGSACPGCTVEIFSNPNDDEEGKHYLGSGSADGGGNFSFALNLFSWPYLTATATDFYSGTSEFSAVYTYPVKSLYLPLVLRNHPQK